MTYPNQSCQSHKSCSLPAIFPDFYKGQRCFGLETIICKLVYRKLQRIIGFSVSFSTFHLWTMVFAFYIPDGVSLNRFLQKWQFLKHKLRLFRFLKRLLFSEEKKWNTAKSIQWVSLLLTGLPKGGRPIHKMPLIFFRCVFLATPGGGVPSTLQILTRDLFQTNTYKANVRQFPSAMFCSQNVR